MKVFRVFALMIATVCGARANGVAPNPIADVAQEQTRFFAVQNAMETAGMEMQLWGMSAAEYRGVAGARKLALDNLAERHKAMSALKEEAEYRKDSPAIVTPLKEAIALAIDYFDNLGQRSTETAAAHQSRIANVRRNFDAAMSRVKAEIELAK